MFKRATKSQAKLRMALMGPSGSGKTYTALTLATALAPGRVAVIDTEHGSASKYGDQFTFDVLELSDYHPKHYIDAIAAAGEAGAYDVLVIDSLSHAWNGAGGVLELVDKAARRSESKNTFAAWRDATPLHNQLVEALLAVPLHLLVTMRSKTEYVLEKDERTGKTAPRKIGLAPIQREGMEYEFDVVAEMDMQNTLMVTKTRIPRLAGKVIPHPGAPLATTLSDWLEDGEPLHWVLNGGGQRFNARMKALREAGAQHLTAEYVLAHLEPAHALEKLGDTTLTEADALARLEELAD